MPMHTVGFRHFAQSGMMGKRLIHQAMNKWHDNENIFIVLNSMCFFLDGDASSTYY